MGDLRQDLRYAVRMLRQQPGFAAAAVLTLALGIGANTAIFSLINATLLQRLPVADRDRLVYMHRGTIGNTFSFPLYKAIRDGNHIFESVAVWASIEASLNADAETELVPGFIVTGNFFDLLGIKASRGRLLTQLDDVTPGAHPVAVISHEYWQTRFAARSDIIGHEIRLNGHPFTIVGVTPADFPGPQVGRVRPLYVPMMMQAIVRPPRAGYAGEQNPDLLDDPRSWLSALGRLKPGVDPNQASAELATIATAYDRGLEATAKPTRILLVSIDEGDPRQRQQLRAAALLLGGVVAAVLLIGCANVANLLLSRTTARRRELALRLAVGASRARLVRQLLTESALLSTIGGVLGIALAWSLVQLAEAAPPPAGVLPIQIEFSIDQRVLAFSVLLSLVTGVVFGIAPALNASRAGLVPALKDASVEIDEHGRRWNLQNVLVVAEVALSMLLLIPAGLFVRSLNAARSIDPGIDVDKIVSAPLTINLLRYTSAQGRAFYEQVVDRAASLPGVEAASVARVGVLSGDGRILSFAVEGRPDGAPADINANVVSAGFFATLGVRLVRGRDFNAGDSEGRPLVAIINETAARRHFAGEDPLGKRVSFRGRQGPWPEIIGIVRDSKYGDLTEAPLAVAYLPVAQNHETGMTLYVRASVPPASLAAGLRREIQSLEPNLPVPNVQTMNTTVGRSLYAARAGAWLLAAFGALALLLAAVGIYGVLSFSISRRTREMGIRLALGADARRVFLLIIRDGMLLVGAGVLIGVAAGLAGARSLAGFLYGVPASDAATFTTMTVVLVAVAFVACAIPARRAMRVDPIAALRCD